MLARVNRCRLCARVMRPTTLVGPPMDAPRWPDGYTCGDPCPGLYDFPGGDAVLRQQREIARAKV